MGVQNGLVDIQLISADWLKRSPPLFHHLAPPPVNDFLNVLLDSVCSYFIENLCCMFIRDIGRSLSGFGIKVMLASYEFGSFPSFSIFWNSLRRTDITYF